MITFEFTLGEELTKIAPHLKDTVYSVKQSGGDCIITWTEDEVVRTDKYSANKVAAYINNKTWIMR